MKIWPTIFFFKIRNVRPCKYRKHNLEQLDVNLFRAAEKDDVETMKQLLSHGASPDFRNSGLRNQTPLHIAAMINSIEMTQLLLDHNAHIEARDEAKETPLHTAAWCSSVEVAKLLLEYNSDIEARNENNETPLHNTGLCNSAKVTKLLLEHNAYIEAKDKDNRTTLHIAALYNSTEFAQLLLKHDVDIEAERQSKPS